MSIRPTGNAPSFPKGSNELDVDLGAEDLSLDDLVDQLGFLAAQSTLLTLADDTAKAPTLPSHPTKVEK